MTKETCFENKEPLLLCLSFDKSINCHFCEDKFCENTNRKCVYCISDINTINSINPNPKNIGYRKFSYKNLEYNCILLNGTIYMDTKDVINCLSGEIAVSDKILQRDLNRYRVNLNGISHNFRSLNTGTTISDFVPLSDAITFIQTYLPYKLVCLNECPTKGNTIENINEINIVYDKQSLVGALIEQVTDNNNINNNNNNNNNNNFETDIPKLVSISSRKQKRSRSEIETRSATKRLSTRMNDTYQISIPFNSIEQLTDDCNNNNDTITTTSTTTTTTTNTDNTDNTIATPNILLDDSISTPSVFSQSPDIHNKDLVDDNRSSLLSSVSHTLQTENLDSLTQNTPDQLQNSDSSDYSDNETEPYKLNELIISDFTVNHSIPHIDGVPNLVWSDTSCSRNEQIYQMASGPFTLDLAIKPCNRISLDRNGNFIFKSNGDPLSSDANLLSYWKHYKHYKSVKCVNSSKRNTTNISSEPDINNTTSQL